MKCLWETGCSDKARCEAFGECVADHQRRHKLDMLSPVQTCPTCGEVCNRQLEDELNTMRREKAKIEAERDDRGASTPKAKPGLPVPGQALPTDPAARKSIPVYSGFIAYFPRAICAVAELSRIGNDQHNPGKPLHWDRSKSGDEKDALMRHLIDQTIDGDNAADTDGVLHATKKAWRAMADLEKILEARHNALMSRPATKD